MKANGMPINKGYIFSKLSTLTWSKLNGRKKHGYARNDDVVPFTSIQIGSSANNRLDISFKMKLKTV